ncbi:MAG: hypothetical protein HRS57_00885 [Mycoplasmataceae bacterium]|nr:hypothetical protein [Mycoplasmataceae bacterium]
MSDVVGLLILFIISMIAPISLILYLKWDDILNWKLRRSNKSDEDDILREDNKFKKWINTYFGKVETTPSIENIKENLSLENKTAQEILAEQRKQEEIAKKKQIAKKEQEEKQAKKQKEKEIAKSGKSSKKKQPVKEKTNSVKSSKSKQTEKEKSNSKKSSNSSNKKSNSNKKTD